MTVTIALIAVGASLETRASSRISTINSAISDMRDDSLMILAESRFFATPAFPRESGPDFVNCALKIETTLAASALLAKLHAVEAAHGRVREQRWGPRSLDLDLIAFGDAICPNEATWARWQQLSLQKQSEIAPDELILPHPRLADRAFVLVPLTEIAPDWCHPVTGRTVTQMEAALPPAKRAEVKPIPFS